MKNNNVSIPFLYCKLDRAAKLLNCEPIDLIHLGVVGGIELCVMLKGFYSEVFLTKEQLLPGDEQALIKRFCQYSSFHFKKKDKNKSWMEEIEWVSDEIFCAKGHAYGLWVLTDGIEHLEHFGEMTHQGSLFLPGSNHHIVISHTVGLDEKNPYPPVNITLNDVYITKSDIDKIMSGKVGELSINTRVRDDIYEVKNVSRITENKKNKLIKALIEVAYGKGSSERPRSLLNEERSTGELLIDLHKMGIEPPVTGSTLAAYLKDVELDYVEVYTPPVENSKK
ncbi:hypothetical protein ABQ366_07280 [Serratia fonticola]|uniref:hypothetical protein n=1 Tax=Serratia TaxID=613 RepID=UPI001A060818|nr:hypothetical protein [Serratia sp. PL7]MBE0150223.1 hypothetical protein [Serratia fonticola]